MPKDVVRLMEEAEARPPSHTAKPVTDDLFIGSPSLGEFDFSGSRRRHVRDEDCISHEEEDED